MRFSKKWWLLPILAVFLFSSAAFALDVNVMPDGDTPELAYTWVGNNLVIWGNVTGGTGPYSYQWDINNDGTPEFAGAVVNVNDISCTHAYGAAGLYEAKLTVSDSSTPTESDSAIVRIRVLPSMTKEARIQLAIERGLKYLYLRQNPNGSIYYMNYYGSIGTETAASVLAFENRGHKPCTKDLNLDLVVDAADRAIWEKDHIYARTVHKGLDYAISTLTSYAVSAPYDSNGNGVWIADNYGPTGANRGPYKIGMYMMALVGAGDLASGAPNLVATTGPANVIGKTYRTLVEDMVDYCDYAQYHGYSNAYGGWRYGPNHWPDNSACQWPAIGMEAAEFGWGVPIRQEIKDSNFGWIDRSQYFSGYESSTLYGALGYDTYGWGIARTASGICQLSFQGKVKDHPRILAAAKWLGTGRHSYTNAGNVYGYPYGYPTTYSMYAVAKGARIAKIDTNSDGIGDTYSEIQTLDGWDWYDEYSTTLIDHQRSDGSWQSWSYTLYVFDTAWAVEILTKNVFTLRPIADLKASPNPTPANSPVNFDISGSFHQDGTKSLVDWWIDVDNDGTFDLDGSFPVYGPIPYAAGYSDTGADYAVTAKLRVSDNSTPTEYAEDLLVINVTSGNVPPVADPGGPYNGVVGSPITFDGSGSYDPNEGQGIPGDHIVSWEWDLDGDGQYDDASGEVVQYTWSTPYSGNIGLRVTDDMGLSNSAEVYTQVFVVDLWPENYVLVSRIRINRYVYEYEYQFDMRNRGTGDATNVECTLDSWPAQIAVVDNHVDFGAIAAGAVVTSSDTFKFREDRRYPVADFQIRWKLEYDDAGGNHVTFLDFPLR